MLLAAIFHQLIQEESSTRTRNQYQDTLNHLEKKLNHREQALLNKFEHGYCFHSVEAIPEDYPPCALRTLTIEIFEKADVAVVVKKLARRRSLCCDNYEKFKFAQTKTEKHVQLNKFWACNKLRPRKRKNQKQNQKIYLKRT
jgi:hypothetical protein